MPPPKLRRRTVERTRSRGDGGLDATSEAATADSGADAHEGDGGLDATSEAATADSGVLDSGLSDGAMEAEAGTCTTAVTEDGGGIGSANLVPGGDSGACSISLPGPITQVAYDPAANVAYGVDPTDQTVSAIALATHAITYRTMYAVPNAICANPARSRVYVVETGSNFIDELATADLSLLRRIPWPAPSYDPPAQSRFQVYCGQDRLFVVDSSWAPALWTVDNLAECPVVVDHTAAVAGVGGLVLGADESEFYYWYQYGRAAGYAGTDVYRIDVKTWAAVDQTTISYAQGFYRDPLDTPILWDHTRNLIFAKNRVFDANNLATVDYTFANAADMSLESYENAYAMDAASGLLVTRHHVFSTDTFLSLGTVTDSSAVQYFVSADGVLRALTTSPNLLDCQTLP